MRWDNRFDDPHEECLSDDDVKEARDEGFAEGRADVAATVETLLSTHNPAEAIAHITALIKTIL